MNGSPVAFRNKLNSANCGRLFGNIVGQFTLLKIWLGENLLGNVPRISALKGVDTTAG